MANTNTDQLLTQIVHEIEELKGEDIVILDFRGLENSLSEYFVICEGNSNTHVSAIATAVQKNVRKALKERPWSAEGSDNAEWVLLDYSNVVVHVLQREARAYYNIEDLWGDTKRVTIGA